MPFALDESAPAGALSDETADIILDFCRAKDGVPETPILFSEVPLFLGSVAMHLSRFEMSGRSQGLPRHLGDTTQRMRARPRNNNAESDFWMEHQAEWLANFRSIRSLRQC
jgi:hypothetical protein